jgi:putative nucleotidyltransferase with HDIG domain
MDVMAIENAAFLPTVYVVTNNPKRSEELGGVLSLFFDLSVFDATSNAGKALIEKVPDVVLVEVELTRKGGLNPLLTSADGAEGDHPPFIFIGHKGEGFDALVTEFGETSRYLRWPITARKLIDTIGELISKGAEKSWDVLPEIQKKPLKLTVEEYKSIATAIENGEPIDYNSAAVSCAPLADAVRSGAHHDLLKSVQSHHNYTYVHSMRVATLLTLFGHGLGMKGTNLLILSTGGLLHDVGKLVTPPLILDKPGKLTDEEWPIMRDHAVQSAELMEASDDVTRGAQIIAEQHHEMLDGSGYPKGLKGNELNNLARMSVICDIFGALTDKRSYKEEFSAEMAFGILESMTTGIDQNLLAMFKDIFISTQMSEVA